MNNIISHLKELQKKANQKNRNNFKTEEAEKMACQQIEITRYRNERNLMLYPFCSTSKNKRLKAIEYHSSDRKRWLQVTANHTFGMAKIWDFDILRFAISKAGEIKKCLNHFPPSVEFTAYECLKALGRNPRSGKNHFWLETALARLVSTTYRGNIFREDTVEGFTLIGFKYLKKKNEVDRICINFNERLLESIQNNNGLLAIDSNILKEESGIKKRLLELVRVSKGKNEIWEIKLSRLKEMCAHEGSLKEFKRLLSFYKLPWKIIFSKVLNKEDKITFLDNENGTPNSAPWHTE